MGNQCRQWIRPGYCISFDLGERWWSLWYGSWIGESLEDCWATSTHFHVRGSGWLLPHRRVPHQTFVCWMGPNERSSRHWHFMRRLHWGCNHRIPSNYTSFLLANYQLVYFFELYSSHVEALVKAKRGELAQEHILVFFKNIFVARLNKKELAKHYRRRTRGVDVTIKFINDLIQCCTLQWPRQNNV